MIEISNKVKYLNLDPDVAKELVIENEAEKWANQRYSTGMKKGIEQAKIETAKKMIKDKIDLDTITKYTTLTKEELSKLV